MRILIILMLLAGHAGAAEFAVTGQTCIPDDATIRFGRHLNTLSPDPWVTWMPNVVGTIRLLCPIPGNVVAPTRLELYYINNRSCAGCQNDDIKVSYVKMSKSTGFITTVKTLAASTGGLNNDTYQAISTTFSDAYNASQFVYYLRVEMTRSTANQFHQFNYAVVL